MLAQYLLSLHKPLYPPLHQQFSPGHLGEEFPLSAACSATSFWRSSLRLNCLLNWLGLVFLFFGQELVASSLFSKLKLFLPIVRLILGLPERCVSQSELLILKHKTCNSYTLAHPEEWLFITHKLCMCVPFYFCCSPDPTCQILQDSVNSFLCWV